MKNDLNIINSLNESLALMRDYRDNLMSLPDEENGRPHSHGEKDNTRGLRIRAISIAITDLESSCKRFEDALDPRLGEYFIRVVRRND